MAISGRNEPPGDPKTTEKSGAGLKTPPNEAKAEAVTGEGPRHTAM